MEGYIVWRRRPRTFISIIFDDIIKIQKELERMINSLMGYYYPEYPEKIEEERYIEPLTDVYEDKDYVYVTMEIPGIRKEDIKVKLLDNRTLVVKAESKFEEELKDKNIVRRERGIAKFYRRITLPCEVDKSGITAKYNNGVLEIKLPKIEKEEEGGFDIKVE
ncbi:MAG: Hsp20/alpha crystallin family protein [Candidatus Asgardarchaeia archaeon]|nr:Hsp20/alpha crystallin family protein [Candidatus Odinarchaeota archaeon]